MVAVLASELIAEAVCLIRQGRADEGTQRLQEAIALQPSSIEAWGHLAAQMITDQRHQEAVRCYEQVLRLDPHNAEARWRIGDRMVRLGRLDEAEACYRSALDDSLSCHDARCGLEYVEWLRRQVGRVAEASGPLLHDEAIRQRRCENEELAKEHFLRGDVRLTTLPTNVQIETTTRCNLACITCLRGHAPYEAQDLPPAVFERIAQDLLPATRSVNLTGLGEPLLGCGFDTFFAEALQHRTRVRLITNATALSMARLERFARQPTDLAASIDGATRETFESIRRGSRFDRVIGSLRLFKKMRDVYPEVGSKLWINFVAIRRNIEELPALVDLAHDLGAELIVVVDFATGVVPPDIAAEHLSHCPDLANRVFDEAAQRARQRGIAIQLPPKYTPAASACDFAWHGKFRGVKRLFPERDRFPQRCSDPWMSAYISAEGLVRPCCYSGRVMGNLVQERFANIWNGWRYRWFRRRISSFLPPVECRLCPIFWGMNAGNPSVVQAREGLMVKLFYGLEGRTRRPMGPIRDLLRRLSP